MATVSDDFNRADANPIGAPWSTVTGFDAMQIISNGAGSTVSGGEAGAVHTGITPGADQFGQFVFTGTGGSAESGKIFLRTTADGNQGYEIDIHQNVVGNLYGFTHIYRLSSGGTRTQLGGNNSIGENFALNDEWRAEIAGDTISVYLNDVLKVTQTDATYASGGTVGIGASHIGGVGVRVDDFLGGDLSAGPAAPDLTDLDTDEIITEGQTGATITGTDLGATTGDRTLALIQGTVSVTQTQQTGNSTGGTFDVVTTNGTTDLKYGAITARVTRTADSATDDLAGTLNPANSEQFVDLTSFDPNGGLAAIPDLEAGDQVHYRAIGGGQVAGLTIDATGKVIWGVGATVVDFQARAWDVNDATWGDFATIRAVVPSAVQRLDRGFVGHIVSRLGGHLQ